MDKLSSESESLEPPQKKQKIETKQHSEMAKNTKTPVMVLTELTIKKGFPPPEFILIYSKSNTHDNEFTYQVIIEGVCAVGSGKSKKEAKQNTAHRALELLNEKGIYHPDYSTLQDPVQRAQEIPSPKKPPVNCIGTLADLCMENKLPEPQYVEISDVGPPHCREFTYDCRLGSITTRATATTKKQAKQLAAKEMLERTKNIINQIVQEFDVSVRELDDKDYEAVCKFEELSNFNVKPNLTIKVRDYCETLNNLLEEKNIEPASLFKYFNESETLDTLDKLLGEVDLKYKVEVVQKEPHPYIICINVNVDTPFTTIGMDKVKVEVAIQNALKNMFDMIKCAIGYKGS